MNKDQKQNILLRSLLFALLLGLAVVLIIFLKFSTDVALSPEEAARRDSISTMAHPDTTTLIDSETPTLPATEADSLVAPDSLSTDQRVPSEAGYEDGYFAGLNDGLNDDKNASYDESSAFPTLLQRRNYIEGYRRGYEDGYEDGSKPNANGNTPLPHSNPETP